jgi:hypothetical protein
MSATHRYRDGSSITGQADLVAFAAQAEQEAAARMQDWVSALIARGVKAAHPDDGWVDREANSVTFAYARFDLDPQIGDLIALGDPEEYRLVRVVDRQFRNLLTAKVIYTFAPGGERA